MSQLNKIQDVQDIEDLDRFVEDQEIENVNFENHHPAKGDSRLELHKGLLKDQKTINPKYFYDAKGSQLFDEITRLPEYYPSRTEKKILTSYKDEIAQYCGIGSVLIEPGSGSCEKVRLLLDALQPKAYVPLDISAKFLYQSAIELAREFPWLNVHAVCADFADSWGVPDEIPQGKRVIFYPGSTIGNMEPATAKQFLAGLKRWFDNDGGILIGVDLHKSEEILHAAYNDSQGVTAEFNLNVLDNINPILNAEFDPENFSHNAFYNQQENRIEMHLVSNKKQEVSCNSSILAFEKGETIHTENSYKYTLESFTQLVNQSGLFVKKSWVDEDELFSVHFLSK